MTNMEAVQVALPVDLLKAAGVNLADASREAAMLLTLELYRENKISLGRAAELCQAFGRGIHGFCWAARLEHE
jgi:predicted HTH domain antitoxin